MYVLHHKPMTKHLIAAGALATIAAASVVAVTGAPQTATRADVNAYVHVEQPHDGTWATYSVIVDTPAGPVGANGQVIQSGGPSLTCYLLGVDPLEPC